MDDGNVSFVITLICNANTTLCAGCPDTVTITMPGEPEYTAGDVLTCSSNGYPEPTYEWTVDGVPGSTTNTQFIEERDHEYVCTATVTFDNGEMCSDNATVNVTGYSKYQKQYITLLYLILKCLLAISLNRVT